jgi:hypothetical protein
VQLTHESNSVGLVTPTPMPSVRLGRRRSSYPHLHIVGQEGIGVGLVTPTPLLSVNIPPGICVNNPGDKRSYDRSCYPHPFGQPTPIFGHFGRSTYPPLNPIIRIPLGTPIVRGANGVLNIVVQSTHQSSETGVCFAGDRNRRRSHDHSTKAGTFSHDASQLPEAA